MDNAAEAKWRSLYELSNKFPLWADGIRALALNDMAASLGMRPLPSDIAAAAALGLHDGLPSGDGASDAGGAPSNVPPAALAAMLLPVVRRVTAAPGTIVHDAARRDSSAAVAGAEHGAGKAAGAGRKLTHRAQPFGEVDSADDEGRSSSGRSDARDERGRRRSGAEGAPEGSINARRPTAVAAPPAAPAEGVTPRKITLQEERGKHLLVYYEQDWHLNKERVASISKETGLEQDAIRNWFKKHTAKLKAGGSASKPSPLEPVAPLGRRGAPSPSALVDEPRARRSSGGLPRAPEITRTFTEVLGGDDKMRDRKHAHLGDNVAPTLKKEIKRLMDSLEAKAEAHVASTGGDARQYALTLLHRGGIATSHYDRVKEFVSGGEGTTYQTPTLEKYRGAISSALSGKFDQPEDDEIVDGYRGAAAPVEDGEDGAGGDYGVRDEQLERDLRRLVAMVEAKARDAEEKEGTMRNSFLNWVLDGTGLWRKSYEKVRAHVIAEGEGSSFKPNTLITYRDRLREAVKKFGRTTEDDMDDDHVPMMHVGSKRARSPSPLAMRDPLVSPFARPVVHHHHHHQHHTDHDMTRPPAGKRVPPPPSHQPQPQHHHSPQHHHLSGVSVVGGVEPADAAEAASMFSATLHAANHGAGADDDDDDQVTGLGVGHHGVFHTGHHGGGAGSGHHPTLVGDHDKDQGLFSWWPPGGHGSSLSWATPGGQDDD